MLQYTSITWFSNIFTLFFFNNVFLLNKKKINFFFIVYNSVYNFSFFFFRMNIFWIFFQVLYFKQFSSYEILFFGPTYNTIFKKNKFSIYSKFYFLKKFIKVNTILNTNLFIDIFLRSLNLNHVNLFLSNFFYYSKLKISHSIIDFKLMSNGWRAVSNYVFLHTWKSWTGLETINYNDNYYVTFGFDIEEERGQYFLEKDLFFIDKLVPFKKRLKKRKLNFYRFNPRQFYIPGPKFRRFQFKNFFFKKLKKKKFKFRKIKFAKLRFESFNFNINYNLFLSGYFYSYYDYIDLNLTCTQFYYNLSNMPRYCNYLFNGCLFNFEENWVQNLSYRINFKVNNNIRLILTYLNLLNDRINVDKNWGFIFDNKNIFFNYFHIYSYLNEYWVLRSLASTNRVLWNKFLNSMLFQEYHQPNIYTKDLVLGWDINTVIPMFTSSHFGSFSDYSKSVLLSKVIFVKNCSYVWLFNKYIIYILQNWLKKRIFFNINKNVINSIDKLLKNYAVAVLQNKNSFFRKVYFTEEFTDILLVLAYTKDPLPLANWIAKNMGEIDIWKQWALISFIKTSINELSGMIFGNFKVLGIFIRFKGKIGKQGSVRKKRVLIKCGNIHKTDVFIRADTAFSVSRNLTGVIGVVVTVSY